MSEIFSAQNVEKGEDLLQVNPEKLQQTLEEKLDGMEKADIQHAVEKTVEKIQQFNTDAEKWVLLGEMKWVWIFKGWVSYDWDQAESVSYATEMLETQFDEQIAQLVQTLNNEVKNIDKNGKVGKYTLASKITDKIRSSDIQYGWIETALLGDGELVEIKNDQVAEIWEQERINKEEVAESNNTAPWGLWNISFYGNWRVNQIEEQLSKITGTNKKKEQKENKS